MSETIDHSPTEGSQKGTTSYSRWCEARGVDVSGWTVETVELPTAKFISSCITYEQLHEALQRYSEPDYGRPVASIEPGDIQFRFLSELLRGCGSLVAKSATSVLTLHYSDSSEKRLAKFKKFVQRNLTLLLQGWRLRFRVRKFNGVVVDVSFSLVRMPGWMAYMLTRMNAAFRRLLVAIRRREITALCKQEPPPRRDPERHFRVSRLSNIGNIVLA